MTSWVRRLLAAAIVTAALAGPVHAQTGESVEYYALDAIGSVRVVFDANGTILGRMDYTPFGGELFGGSGLPDQRFAGLFRDGEAGLDYAQARSYQVRTGRFNAPDPVYAGMFNPQKWNRYAYALNNPIGFIDSNGLNPQSAPSPPCPTGHYCETVDVKGTAPKPVPTIVILHRPTAEVWYQDAPGTVYEVDWLTTVATLVGSVIPGVGEILDSNVIRDPKSSSTDVLLAGASLILSVLTGGASPNFGAIAQRAATTVGDLPNSAHRGTLIHSEFRGAVDALKLPGVKTEVSYLNGQVVKWGTPGSVRLDIVQYGPSGQVVAIYDLKTGVSGLSPGRIDQIMQHMPAGQTPSITAIRPGCPGGC